MKSIKLTTSQAIVKYLSHQYSEDDKTPLFGGMFAIFGHGNVAGLGEALSQYPEQMPTFRAHNEQAMAHSAIAFAKAHHRRRMMACTTSIGPGATNLVTPCALAHVNRLPVLLLPGDTFANRAPDPVLQQLECPHDMTVSVNDCFKPISRFFDRITRPEQIISSLPYAMHYLTSPSDCGPVTLSLCQDVQAQSFEYPLAFFEPKIHTLQRIHADKQHFECVINLLKQSQKPLIIAGGGVHYSQAFEALDLFASKYGIPVAFTQAGMGALESEHPCAMGGLGVTGNEAANTLALESDLILAIGTRLQDFTTGSRALIHTDEKTLIQVNTHPLDGLKHHATPLICDALLAIEAFTEHLNDWSPCLEWQTKRETFTQTTQRQIAQATQWDEPMLPTDAQVLGAVNQFADKKSVVVCAAGGLPGELHKNWINQGPGTYHVEYGYSCMGYEIAGGLGVKMACPDKEVYVMVGDGSYLMLNSEIATSVQMNQKLTLIVLDNGGFGCIHRLQKACGCENFNNLVPHGVDFVKHAQSLGAQAKKISTPKEMHEALTWAKAQEQTCVLVVETNPLKTSNHGGAWWDVAIPDISSQPNVEQAHLSYNLAKENQHAL